MQYVNLIHSTSVYVRTVITLSRHLVGSFVTVPQDFGCNQQKQHYAFNIFSLVFKYILIASCHHISSLEEACGDSLTLNPKPYVVISPRLSGCR